MNAKKRSSIDKDLESLKKKLMRGSLMVVATDLAERKKKTKTGRMPHTAIIDAVQTLKHEMVVTTYRHALLRMIKRIEDDSSKSGINTVSPLTNVVNNEEGSNTLSPLENLVDSPTLPQTAKAKGGKG
jgi:hypothetical protein